ncbi:aminoglycoside phosphotransferase [Isoptericola cucumis]|uniref:aminoglycoside phosphotransferase n=1 Tax=Isoptericola cucumis TaxID=1776856 RepID=UPI003207D7C2
MTTVRPAAQGPDPSVGDLLAAWLPGRRWFPGGADVRAEPWLAVTFDDEPAADARRAPGGDVVVLLVRLAGDALPGGDLVAQVPLVLGPADAHGPGFIADVRTGAGDVAVHDGGAHPAAWLAMLHAMGATGGAADDALVAGGRVLAGEQSNTSVVLPGVPSPDGAGAILKVLRTVAPGPHPDVVVPQTLTRAGWEGVPRFLGALEVPAPGGEPLALAVLSELVPDADDGFELACAYAGRGESFAQLAAGLGRVVAGLHTVLRRSLPPGPLLEPASFVAGLRRRAAEAVAEAPSLAPRAGQVGALLDDLRHRLPPVRLQAIHGDLHLGQSLHGPGGWRLLDFEGEPQRPVAERTAPDLRLRDVAGMLRSFDYAAAVGGAPDPAPWRAEAGYAFAAAYQAAAEPSGMDPPTYDAALRALVLDKALYEVVYESRQRPDWVHIPLAAVDRVLDGAGSR